MKKTFFTLLFALSAFFAQAQSYKVLVTDENGIPLEHVSVAILNAKDSTFISGGITDTDGYFFFDNSVNESIIRVSMIGYTSQYFSQPFPEKIQLPLSSFSINEVKVKGERKYIKNTHNGLIVKVANSPLSQLASIDDAIKQMPLINPNDGSVLGKGMPEIYINNKKVRDTNELKQLSPERVENVEIITRPSSKYDSDVRAVLIIRTKKQEHDFAGILTGNGSFSDVFSENVNADLSYMFRNGIGLYGGVNLSDDGYKQKRTYTEVFNDYASKTITNGAYKSRSLTGKMNLGISYDLSPDNSIGVFYNFKRMPKSHFKSKSDISIFSPTETEEFGAESETKSQNYQHAVNAYWHIKFGKKKNVEFSTDADYVYGSKNGCSNTNEAIDALPIKIATGQKDTYYLWAAKSNLSFSIKNTSIDMGLQYSFTKNQMSFDGEGNTSISFLSSSYDIEKQHLFAVYTDVVYPLNENWSINGGLRLENTSFDHIENGKRNEEQSKKITDFIPKIGVNYQKNDWTLALTYSSFISRPDYSSLNNNYFYVSHTSWETGNPLLKSAKVNLLDLNISWKKTIFEIMYSRKKRLINTVYTYMPTDNVNVRQEINLPDYNDLILIASQRFDAGIWHPMVQGMLGFQDLEYGDPNKRYDRPIAQITMNNRFDLPWGIYAYLGGAWTSKGHQATVYSEGDLNLYIMLNKNIKNWTFNIFFNDFANTYRQKNLVETNGILYGENRKGASRLIQIGVTYMFKDKKTFKGRNSAQEEMNRL